MRVLAVWVGKLTLLSLRLIGRRGNALPGLVVEKVFPRFLASAMGTLPEGYREVLFFTLVQGYTSARTAAFSVFRWEP